MLFRSLVVALQLIEASQLSLVDVPSVATVEKQSPGCVLVTMLVGHDATGSSLSVTVTVNVHEPVFPEMSVALQETVVLPRENTSPLLASHEAVSVSQLSLTVGEAKVAAPLQAPVPVLTNTSDGHETIGASLSLTTTLNEHISPALLDESDPAVHDTPVVPRANSLPDAMEHVMPTSPSH